jgi:predicted nucleotidyltransferase
MGVVTTDLTRTQPPAGSQDAVLHEIVTRLVEALDPERLILFGSRAAGRARPDSDYDILIVKDQPDSRLRRTGPLYSKLWGIRGTVDLLWFTPQEVEDWSRVRQHVATQAVRNGIVIYERPRGPRRPVGS